MYLLGFISPWEILIVGLVILLLFGNRLPGLMRSLGRGVVEFKKGVQGIEDDTEESPKIQR
ncbi:MAG: twin-arginine translocase TatA/TatE family subunit [Planctomycetia bacterium]|nr:twin-arginine translocase TatA/TatE family subunit [Planctomycetia bacterium]